MTVNKVDDKPPPKVFGRKAKLITIDVDKLTNWRKQAAKINSIDDLPKRVELILMEAEATTKDKEEEEKPPTPQGKVLHRRGAFDWPSVPEKKYPDSNPIKKLQINLEKAIRSKEYHMIRGHIEELQNSWPMSPRQYVGGLEKAIMMSCKNNDPHGLSVCVHTIGYLPPELCGRALYICAMHGNALAGKEVLPYTTIEEKKKALFKAVELRHGDMITLILNDDKEKTLINHMLNAAGGGQVLLGHALELGAETGDCALTTAVLEHIYDGRVHAGPKFNDPRPKIDSFGRPISTYQTERAHLWCWPSILRAKNVATVRGNIEIAHIIQMWSHGSRPSAPSTARLGDNHSHHSGIMSLALGRHKTHRYQKKWHPRELTSASRYESSAAEEGWASNGSIRSRPKSFSWDGVKQIEGGKQGFKEQSTVFNESTMDSMTMRSRGGLSATDGSAAKHVMGLLTLDTPSHVLDGGDSDILTTASMGLLAGGQSRSGPSEFVSDTVNSSRKGKSIATLPSIGLGASNAEALAAKLTALQVSGTERWAASAGINDDLDANSFRESDASVKQSRFYQYGTDMQKYRANAAIKAEAKQNRIERDRMLGISS